MQLHILLVPISRKNQQHLVLKLNLFLQRLRKKKSLRKSYLKKIRITLMVFMQTGKQKIQYQRKNQLQIKLLSIKKRNQLLL